MKNEPTPPATPPKPPAWLSVDALEVWNEFAPICSTMGTLSLADTMPMACYTELIVQWRKCQAVIDSDGMTYPILTEDGKSVRCICQRPEVSIGNRLSIQLRALEGDLGLNAVARGRIDIPPEKRPKASGKSTAKQDPKERFFA